MSTNLFCGENRRDKEEGKRSNKAERGSKAPTRNALALSYSLSLSLSVVVFKADLSLQPLSCLFCVGENNRVLTHNKEEAKKLEQSRGVKKYEQKLL